MIRKMLAFGEGEEEDYLWSMEVVGELCSLVAMR